MIRKNLGVIQIDLGNIELTSEFGENDETDITSQLSTEQKEIIVQALKGEKIVLIKGFFVDSAEKELKTILNIGRIEHSQPADIDVIYFELYDYGSDKVYSLYISISGVYFKIYS